MKTATAIILSVLAVPGLAQQPAYAQCGGTGWTGGKTCVSGYTCVYSNEWYSQCVPGSGGGATTTTKKTSTLSTKTTKISTTKTTKAATTTKGGSAGSTNFPASAGTTALPTAKVISGTFDGGLLRWERNPSVCQGQSETGEAEAMFILEDGAHIKNAIIGASQAEGIHCRGTCTIENVWWADVCEDAATFKQASGTSYVIGGGAKAAEDKIFQFNGRGTVSIKNFYANDYGKVIRSCGDCTGNGGPRNIIIDGVTATNGGPLCGINTNYGDTCRISNSCQTEGKSCDLFQGSQTHDGSKKLSSGPDNKSCFVTNPTC